MSEYAITSKDPNTGPYTIDAPLEISDELVDEIRNGAYAYSGYWAIGIADADDTEQGPIAVIWLEDENDPKSRERKVITRQELARGLAEIAFGKGARSDLVEHARRAILEKDAGEIDAEIADVALQYAVFGEIVFG